MKLVTTDNSDKEKAGETFLMHAANELQADTVESLLRSYEIPVLKKRRETGGYLNIATGMNVYGVDLYVPSKLYKAAVALVRTRKAETRDQATELRKAVAEFKRKRLLRIWIIIGIFYLPVFIWLITRAFH